MSRNGRVNGSPSQQDWRCSVERREKSRLYFAGLEGVAWNRRLLQMRRASALHARRQREEQGGALSPEGRD